MMLYLAAYLLIGGVLTNAIQGWSKERQPKHRINEMGPLPWVLLSLLWPVFVISTLFKLLRRLGLGPVMKRRSDSSDKLGDRTK